MAERVNGVMLSAALLILRVGAGSLLIYGHGWSKLTHFGEKMTTFSDPIGLGPTWSFTLVVFAEVVCSALVMLGLFARIATAPLLIFFAVAVFVQHAPDPFAKKELPMLYAFTYAAIALAGPGRYSLDALRHRG